MEPARPRVAHRRPRRGTVERPLDTRLVRLGLLVVLAALTVAVFSIERPGPLPAPTLPPRFDAAAARQLAAELARDFPRRVPGSLGGEGAVGWMQERLALYGLDHSVDSWREDVPGLGKVELQNVVVVVPGRSAETIVIVAHRDNGDPGSGANDNATGTATLIELARGYASTDASGGGRATPLHTLVFLSSDGGDYGGVGGRRFVATYQRRDDIAAVISLDALGGRSEPRLEIASYESRSPATPLLRTVATRVAEQTGAEPVRPGWLAQVVDLALPFGYGEQAPFLAAGIPAVRLGTAPNEPGGAADVPSALDRALFAQLGRAAEAILGSLDAAIELSRATSGYVYLGDRVVRGWAIQLVFLASIVPFAIGVLDLVARCQRRGLRLLQAFRPLGTRLLFWGWVALVVGIAATAGVFPVSGVLPPPPEAVEHPPLGLAIVVGLALLGWLRSRARLQQRRPATAEEELAGYTAALLCLLGVAVVLAVCCPYTLAFVLPALYAWLWLPLRAPSWPRDVLYGVGLLGPVLAVVALAEQLDLGLAAPLYALDLLTLGVVPWPATLALLGWAAAAGQIGALTGGRYASGSVYASGR
jgi:hypothetical protein